MNKTLLVLNGGVAFEIEASDYEEVIGGTIGPTRIVKVFKEPTLLSGDMPSPAARVATFYDVQAVFWADDVTILKDEEEEEQASG